MSDRRRGKRMFKDRVIVCLCGSTRFSKAYQEANLWETLAGRIVLTIGCDLRTDAELFREKSVLSGIKRDLDTLHLDKIELAHEILVLNVDGHTGQSTMREIAYAIKLGKRVRFWNKEEAIDLSTVPPFDTLAVPET